MATGFAEHLDEQVGGAVDDGRVLGEVGGRRHVAAHAHDAGDAIDRPQGGAGGGEPVEGALTREGVALLDGHVDPAVAGRERYTRRHGDLAGDGQQVAVQPGGDVRPGGSGRLRQLDSQLLQTFLDAHHAPS